MDGAVNSCEPPANRETAHQGEPLYGPQSPTDEQDGHSKGDKNGRRRMRRDWKMFGPTREDGRAEQSGCGIGGCDSDNGSAIISDRSDEMP